MMLIDCAQYQCDGCLAVQEVEYATSGSSFEVMYLTDCYMYTPLWIEKPKLIKCWNCGKLHWVMDLQEYTGEQENWDETDMKQTTGFKIDPIKPMWKKYDKLNQDDYHYLLQAKLFRESVNEQELRKQAFWARNDKFRYPVELLDCRRLACRAGNLSES
ncbi:MAG: hypothetical protein RBR69_07600 [Candidatus Cloacimonadaceae bacterium]|jgi:hypothetical protein|nr:hypothetical protein [Candidatus Cloacimonadota bacterium]MCK9243419.1 hypothetical protein [Candidatus Cloacimonadota bacterium]MDD3102912.1 hypothetical protein [Candidatus Cloacimonadota bacterium]MDY0127979.1 hypothetical protein [Candidatus Cloacimonadaceae bacterium]